MDPLTLQAAPAPAPAQDITSSAERMRLLHIAMIAGAVILGIGAIWIAFLRPQKSKTTTAPAAATGGTDGTTGAAANPGTVYTPSTQTYTDLVINEGNTSSNVTNNDTVTGNSAPVTINPLGGVEAPPPPPAPPAPPPVPTPPPVATSSAGPPPPAPPLTRNYMVTKGDTLSAIAARYGTTWQNLYNLNKTTIDTWAARHGNPIPGGPWNNIFINEPIQVPA